MRTLGLSCVIVGLALCGCTPAAQTPQDSSSQRTDARRPTAVAESTWRRPLEAIGQPVMADGVAVVLALVRGDELDIVALDPRSGKVRWRAPYSPGDVSPGYGLEPLVTEDGQGRIHVVFQRPERNLTGGSDSSPLPSSRYALAAVRRSTAPPP